MSDQWVYDYMEGLKKNQVDIHPVEERFSEIPAKKLDIEPADWGIAAKVASDMEARWCGVWGDDRDNHFAVIAVFEKDGVYLMIRTIISTRQPVIPSHTPWYPGANRMERHTQDMLGIAFLDNPDARRWTRHKAWGEGDYPLRNNFPVEGKDIPTITPPDNDYQFQKAQGSAVYEIPVGPVHAGIIEPGHFRFQAVGEKVIQLEEHLGYVHKGIEKIAVGRDPKGLARLAARVSGDSTVAHGWAACQAMERATQTEPPLRAKYLRALMAERERVANHLGDIGSICNDVGFNFAYVQFSRLREVWQRRSDEIFLHRMMMDNVIPGGVSRDIKKFQIQECFDDLKNFRRQLRRMMNILDDHPSLTDRIASTGRLYHETAAQFGSLGYVGRASGQDRDVRRDTPYVPYNTLEIEVPVSEIGDVLTRLQIRAQEIRVSFELQQQLLKELPEGDILVELNQPNEEVKGLGIVEGWRGEIISYVRLDEQGKVARFFPRDPSWFNWPALEKAVLGNIVPDFPVVNKSVNGSYSGQDL